MKDVDQVFPIIMDDKWQELVEELRKGELLIERTVNLFLLPEHLASII